MALDAAQRRALLTHPAGWIALGFGSGLSPWAPGTAGSAVAVVAWLPLSELAWPWLALVLVAAFVLGVWACAVAARRIGLADPGAIVWDEFVGQWIALAAAPRGWPWLLAAFALFRLFDIAKPGPVRWADRNVHGGWGVMLDDVVAGALAALVLLLARQFV